MRPALNLDNVPAGHPEGRSARPLAIALGAPGMPGARGKGVVAARFTETIDI